MNTEAPARRTPREDEIEALWSELVAEVRRIQQCIDAESARDGSITEEDGHDHEQHD